MGIPDRSIMPSRFAKNICSVRVKRMNAGAALPDLTPLSRFLSEAFERVQSARRRMINESEGLLPSLIPHAENLFDGSHAFRGFAETIFYHGHHTLLHTKHTYFLSRSLPQECVANDLINF